MKIAIPVEKQNLDAQVAQSFGRAPHFLFYNTKSKESYYLDNTAVADSGGAGIRAAQVVADHGAEALLTPRCGNNAQEVLSGAEVLIYKSIPGTALENIEAFIAEKLVLLDEFHSGMHRHG
ncbi:MAG: NifB/NifX family molybdenum-iron cluster-binding protein [Acutalibacteraceae bacterium]|jgi:predicted Fe-Mo cluster-binding NifX family protein